MPERVQADAFQARLPRNQTSLGSDRIRLKETTVWCAEDKIEICAVVGTEKRAVFGLFGADCFRSGNHCCW